MSLNFDLSDIENCKDLWQETGKVFSDGEKETTLKAVPHVVIMCSMACDFSAITEKNVDEVYQKLYLMQLLAGGGYIVEHDKETNTRRNRFLTYEEVRSMIGLKLNVVNIPLKTWLRKRLPQIAEGVLSTQMYRIKEAKNAHRDN